MAGIDINLASADQFDSFDFLKGHGFEIVRFRDERGGFTDVKQLDEVPGLTGKLCSEHYEKLAAGTG
jgi:DNA uptake protein ComE-like DNA-binding protein